MLFLKSVKFVYYWLRDLNNSRPKDSHHDPAARDYRINNGRRRNSYESDIPKRKRPDSSIIYIITLESSQPSVAAKIITVKMTARINNKQQALDRAFFWYLAALLNSRSAPLVSVLVFSTLLLITSNCSPCSLTMCATSLNSSFNSVTPCSMFRISASRSTIKESWKSTSSCEASRSCSCDCCCPN